MDRIVLIRSRSAPALDRIMYPVHRPPCITRTGIYARLRMTLQAQACKLIYRLGHLRCGTPVPVGVEGILIDMIIRDAGIVEAASSPSSTHAHARRFRSCILFIGRGHPCAFQERNPICLVRSKGRTYAVRVMTWRTETANRPVGRGL